MKYSHLIKLNQIKRKNNYMETKLKKLLRKRNISQKKLYDKISKIYETPIGQYALSEIVNGKKLNYHIITLVKICNVLNVKPQSIVESDSLDMQLLKPEYIKANKKPTETVEPSSLEEQAQAKHTNWEDEDVDSADGEEALKVNKG
tara:strand:- start:24539 stop:24976 length:438 start_codon:yes stop_codon:yes gene_type:complete